MSLDLNPFLEKIKKDAFCSKIRKSIIEAFEEVKDTIENNNIQDLRDFQKKTDESLDTENKEIVGAINEVSSQCKDIVKQTITTEERTKLNSLNNYDDTTVKTNIQNVQQQVNNLVLGAVGDGNNAEVVQARGNYTVLNDRFDSIENELYIAETLNSSNCIGFNDSTQPITANGVTLTVRNGAF